ncbi:MAG: flagellar basal-body rod protein FlgG [Lachnospiraceae bacterium]|nr:flagellar basal-body rod protein FlgG [Lachnospiraceae bacterium]
MVRSLWTAATGMIAQQTNVDTIANNLANVNTVGYKTEVNEFKSLLYQNIQTKTTKADGSLKPVGAQVGLGVRNSSITSLFKQGSLLDSESDSAFAIDGKGFFSVQGEDGNTYYTRNGNFQWTLGPNDTNMLCTSDGLPVLDSNGRSIAISKDYIVSDITITADGELCYPDDQNNAQSMGIRMGIFQFSNPAGLEKQSDGLFDVTDASGQAINEATSTSVTRSKLIQGYVEGSNVQVVDEMVNMIVAQRAYELNSKAITASDEMLQQANNLRR